MAGFTLIEIGVVVALLGLIAVLVADYYANQLGLRYSVQRVEGTVRDARSIIDASVAWAAVNGDEWPNDREPDPAITLRKLVEEGYLIHIPASRYSGCEGGCRNFAITGWDRAAARATVPPTPCMGPPEHTLSADSGNYDANPATDDLVLCFDVRGTSDALAVASRLPQGRLYQTIEQIGTDAYQVEARVLGRTPLVGGGGPGGSDQFVRRIDEGRPVIFADTGGELQNVRRVSSINHAPLQTFEDPLPRGASGLRFLNDGSSVDPAEDAITAGVLIDGRLFMQGGSEADIYFGRIDDVNDRYPLRGLAKRICRLEAANALRPIGNGSRINLDGSCERLNRL